MEAELDQYLNYLGYLSLAGFGLFFLRVVLSLGLKKRLSPGLVPDLEAATKPDGLPRFVALIGYRAAAPNTLGTRRLRATFGLQLVMWGLLAFAVKMMEVMEVPLTGLWSVIPGLILYLAIHTSLYEISFDQKTITLPRWWFGRTVRRWTELDAVVENQGWSQAFHFRDGTVVQVHKYVVGFPELRDTAHKAMREV
jgi:hypothetical protein